MEIREIANNTYQRVFEFCSSSYITHSIQIQHTKVVSRIIHNLSSIIQMEVLYATLPS